MQAVILAAGEGKRVRPLTKNRPKAMVPVANRPIIEYVIDALIKNGIREIIVVVGYRKELVTRYLNKLDIPVEVVVQNKQLGTGHALLAAEHKIEDNFLVLPGDNYIDPSSIARIRDHPNAILVKEHPSPSNFGVVMLSNGHVTQIIEKPEHAPSFLVSTGICSLTKEIFSHIRENDLTDAISSLIASGEKIQGIPADDWQDAIYAWDLLKMNRRFLQNIPPARDGIISRQAYIQGSVQIGKGTTIGPNTVITGPAIIGTDCTIGPNCCILPNSSIGSRVIIEPFTVIGNTIVMDDTTIGSQSHVIDTIIGERCRLADHLSISTIPGIHDIEGVPTRSEFGAILGDSITSGPFSILKNSLIGNNVTIEGHARLSSRQIQDNSLVI
jgi:glucose-1-phosphate thymidylyltransferase